MQDRVRRGPLHAKGVFLPVQVVVGGGTLLTRENSVFAVAA